MWWKVITLEDILLKSYWERSNGLEIRLEKYLGMVNSAGKTNRLAELHKDTTEIANDASRIFFGTPYNPNTYRDPSYEMHTGDHIADDAYKILKTLSVTRKSAFHGKYINNDAPEPWGYFFQDNATPQMEGLEELHNNIMYYLCIILFAVTWIMVSIILNYRKDKTKISNKYVNHGTLVELIWTITPALILILIAFPSFKLLYLMDEVIDPSLVIYGEGHQWYWSYQYPDFVNNDEEYVEYDSYIIPESDLELGKLRMLEVDNRVIIPELTHTRFIVAGADVIHSYACPSLGVKCDAYPGRLNQSSVYLNREGTFFGQCSEICGILHSSMPISIQSVNLPKFLYWTYDQLGY